MYCEYQNLRKKKTKENDNTDKILLSFLITEVSIRDFNVGFYVEFKSVRFISERTNFEKKIQISTLNILTVKVV